MNHRELARTLRLATAGERPRLSERARTAILACDDYAALARLAVEHRVAPWLAAAVASDPEASAEPGATVVSQAGAAQVFQTLELFGEMTRVVSLLNGMDIPVVVLKGPGIAETFYPDPGLRPYRDVDLLIHESDLARVSALLEERGYADKNGEVDPEPHRLHRCHGIFQRIFMNEATGHVVEVHCDHLQIGLEPVSMDRIWASSAPAVFGKASARVLEPHDLFVQLCVHLHRHGFEHLVWFKDLDLMVRRGGLDWGTVRAKAEEQGCLDSISYSLWLLRGQLGTPLPEGARRLAGQQSRLARAALKLVWPPDSILGLVPQRQWRLRRIVQFAPETGILRGGLPSLLLMGRRNDKLRVLLASMDSH